MLRFSYLSRTGVLLGLFLFLASAVWGGREFPQQSGEKVVPDELLVKLAAGARFEDLTALLPSLSKVTQLHRASPHFRLQLPPGLAKQVSARLVGSRMIEYVEPNRIRDHA